MISFGVAIVLAFSSQMIAAQQCGINQHSVRFGDTACDRFCFTTSVEYCYITNKQECVCDTNFFKNSEGKCVSRKECAKRGCYYCNRNETLDMCVYFFQSSCKTFQPVPRRLRQGGDCQKECVCKSDFVRNLETGGCVLPEDCP